MFPSFDKLGEAEFDQNCRLLDDAGFSDGRIAVQNLMRLREASLRFEKTRPVKSRRNVPAWFRTLKRILLEAPLPGAVLDAVDEFVRIGASSDQAFALFEDSPRSLEVLARLACGSPFLTRALMNQPDALRELTTERRTADMKSREDFVREAQTAIRECELTPQKLSALRRFQRREILRIGMCDAFGLLDLKFVTLQISLLADAMVQLCLQMACDDVGVAEAPLAVLALGKQGGEELNYSSDIDLVLIAESNSTTAQKVAHRLIGALGESTATGFLYRVDMRLRPWGDAGPLVSTPDTYEDYLRTNAELWEKQALLKARVIAGDSVTGNDLLSRLPPLLFAASADEVLSNVRSMKGQIEDKLRQTGKLASEVKLGAGSIRDIEFLVQALQLIHGRSEPRLASANTMDALVRLAEFGVLDATIYRQLREGYVFLRTIEHALQLLHNQQTHELPADAEQREWLARRLDYPSAGDLLTRFNEHRKAVRRIFDSHFGEPPADPNPNPMATSNPQFDSQQGAMSPLTIHFREHGERHQQLQYRFQQDLDSGAACVVHSEHCLIGLQLLTITAPSTPGLMSIVCGLLFSNRLDIREGVACTGPGSNRFGHAVPRHRFLGVFLCEGTSGSRLGNSQVTANAIQEELEHLLSLQQNGQESDVREMLLQMFCSRVADLPHETLSLADLTVEVSNSASMDATELTISADDSVGFFFELSNALAICGFRILRAELGETDGRIRDVLHVTETDGSVVTSHERIEELRTAVTLIKQFTNWLPSNNDPHQALLRFRDLLHVLLRKSQWENSVATLQQPAALYAVSRVLGISRYLWEDFLQVRTEHLLPLLTNADQLQNRVTRESLVTELGDSLMSAADVHERSVALNTFKDNHLFRIDLRHVLGHCAPFGAFSQEITELAEVVVDAACQTAFAELTATHGPPALNNGAECPFVIVALGKFGGIEMGYASDIEMFLIFQEECRTDGQNPISANSFFERLVHRITELIQCRHQGIFEIDLRMRPYGQAGSPAVSMNTFGSYFAADGDAWPYERQSLVKLRCVSGDPELGQKVLEECHSLIYTGTGFDFGAMRAMREKQIRQLVRGGTVNAKLSDGGLVDCEYAVQALQLTFGHRLATLRTSNTLKAMHAALQENLLSPQAYESATSAYIFLRELIDCLRMAHGNAEDLTVPTEESADYAQLAKRMETVHESPRPLQELESQLAIVRAFAARVVEICEET